ncbi:Eukaryotic initiation factor 4F subunit p150 isoform 1 [Gossypium australe]|uniref:Eukaryotic initiation factor 4F subunit p150 isoform 1 n=1 Tax=Gossypium australe TaxID=47621 RepID=A0A5B6W7W4_9ROSI|nr:Eukaryotic initiation factor 4F subunit p150 isoform 1 [Gossypium australe]
MELATSFVSGAQLNLLCPKNLTTSTSRSYKLPKRTKFLSLHSLLPPPFSNAFICKGSSFGFINHSTSTSSTNSNISNRFYKRLDSCLIIPPSGNKKPRAIIKFLGGAFLGAVPEVTYSYLIELLAKEGFLIISVPYNVTFDHEQATKQVYERFNACLDNILAFGYPDANLTPADLVNLPLFSVGHSNGALLQVLTGSYFSEKIPKANAIISYNNKSATEAVPYFEQLGPLVRQMMPMVETSPMYSMARSASDDAWKMFIDTAGAMIPERDQEALVSFTNFVDQLPSVFGQVYSPGQVDFLLSLCNLVSFRSHKGYQSSSQHLLRTVNVARTNTMSNIHYWYTFCAFYLVKFNFDTIDETDLLEETLKPRVESIVGTLEKVQLSGNHITPCVPEPKWQAGYVYTPADAIAQGFKTLSLSETKVLSRTISDWFRRFEE